MSAAEPQAPIYVVSGIPRSGTSLVMQLLEAAGLPILADAAREADASNPRGYFELAAVKATPRDAGWVARAPGHAVKVIHALLPWLPLGYRYRVVLIERDLAEVIDSQARMLERNSENPANPSPARDARDAGLPPKRLQQIFAAQLAETRALLDAREDFEWIALEHAALVADPTRTAGALAAFIQRPRAAAAMAAVVDPTLHRERSAQLGGSCA